MCRLDTKKLNNLYLTVKKKDSPVLGPFAAPNTLNEELFFALKNFSHEGENQLDNCQVRLASFLVFRQFQLRWPLYVSV